jgi:hypothetical protein
LTFKPSECTYDEHGRNVPDGDFDGFGNFSLHRAEYVPFELERPILRRLARSDKPRRLAV